MSHSELWRKLDFMLCKACVDRKVVRPLRIMIPPLLDESSLRNHWGWADATLMSHSTAFETYHQLPLSWNYCSLSFGNAGRDGRTMEDDASSSISGQDLFFHLRPLQPVSVDHQQAGSVTLPYQHYRPGPLGGGFHTMPGKCSFSYHMEHEARIQY